MSFGERIRELRLHQEFLQSDIAKQLGITQSQYSKIERGAVEPSMDVIRGLARIFNVSADYLLEIETALDYEPTFDLKQLLLHGRITMEGKFLSREERDAIYDMVRIFIRFQKKKEYQR